MRLALLFVFVYYVGLAQFPNILISSQLQPKGVSIAINPKNSKQIIAGAGMANAYFSEDGGSTWKKNENICQAFELYGLPKVFWDTARIAYFSDLAYPNPKVVTDGSWVDRVIINRSEDFGKTYIDCEDFGKNEKKVQYRHSACVDQKTNAIHITWTQFNKFESRDAIDTSLIKYSKSLDGGKSWTDPKTISSFVGNCSNGDSTLMGAVPCLGTEREIYVTWAGPKGLMFQRSVNGGVSWLPSEKIIFPLKNGWNSTVGANRANGLPVIACDLSKGTNKGRVYICWCDEKNGETNKDVFLTYSDDKGESWTDPILVTYYPNNKEQFMPVMTIDQTTGYIYILYYTQQNSLNDGSTDVQLAISKNGGLKFDHYKINERSFVPVKDKTFGEFIGISVVNNFVRPIWMQHDKKKELNVYTAIMDEQSIQKYNADQNTGMELQKSFGFSDEIKITFNLKDKSEISAAITKPLEAGFEKTVVKNKKFKPGNNTLLINTKKLGLQRGSYILTLYYNNRNNYTWITEE